MFPRDLCEADLFKKAFGYTEKANGRVSAAAILWAEVYSFIVYIVSFVIYFKAEDWI